jgi:predicted RNA binding protein YcfA (HicA-like mRNA interferase family)
MSFPPNVWSQIKNKTCDEIISALIKDGWKKDSSMGSQQIFRKGPGQRVSIHYHPRKTYGPALLKGLLNDIGWTEEQMRNLKFIK